MDTLRRAGFRQADAIAVAVHEQVSNFVTVVPNEITRACAAGTVEHAWLSRFAEGSYVSVSLPSSICLTFSRHVGAQVLIAGIRSSRDVNPGCVSITGPEPVYWTAVREPAETIEVVASAAVRTAIADEMGVPRAAALEDMHVGSDRVVWAIAARLRTGLRADGDEAPLAYDELIWRLYRHIFATRFGGRLRERGDGKLDARRLDRVLGFIEGHLTDRGLNIATLAAVAALSPFHFLRSFRRTLHMTPHRYVRARRLEQAREEIAAGRDAEEVAHHYGFAHLGHFRNAYRRHHGLAIGEQPHQRLDARSAGPEISATS